MTTVLISGASGFIALYTVKLLLEKGYTVVGSVRSAAKGDHIKELVKTDKFSYEIVADIEKANAFDDFVKNHPEATVFLHTASPFHFKINDIEKEMLYPAINGTKSALLAVKKYGPQIERVVVTSSYAAMASAQMDGDKTKTWDETSWNDITWASSLENVVYGYYGSKTFAEKAAWDFVKEEKPNFVLTTVNPVYVFGPQAYDSEVKDNLNTSSEIINNVMKLSASDKEWGHAQGVAVDVRDVAEAHLVAFEKDEAKEERLFLYTGFFTDQTILDVLHKNFPTEAANLPIGTPGSDATYFANRAQLDNSKTKKILGFNFRTVEETVADSAAQIYAVRK